MTFRPTRAPRARLTRLGVVLDARGAAPAEVAKMCDGAGIDAIWLTDPMAGELPPDGWSPWETVRELVVSTSRIRLGVVLPERWSADEVALAVDSLDDAARARMELTATPRQLAEGLRGLLPEAMPLSSEAATSEAMDVVAHEADDAVLPAAAWPRVEEMIQQVRSACRGAGRDPDGLGIALRVPVSIGRTRAEAEARAHNGGAVFAAAGSPAEVGVFGTLEQCQERVVALAHASVSDLRCHLPDNPDIHDVIAQLTAITVGTIDVLAPGAPRSRDPDPPSTWGGRRIGSMDRPEQRSGGDNFDGEREETA